MRTILGQYEMFYYLYSMRNNKYSFRELRVLIQFVRAQGSNNIKSYIDDRALDLEMSVEDTMDELITSAMDLEIDRIYNQPYGGFITEQ